MKKEDLFAERYNRAVDSILSDTELQEDFFTILDEQKAVMIEDGRVSEAEAETYVCQMENLRRAAMFFIN